MENLLDSNIVWNRLVLPTGYIYKHERSRVYHSYRRMHKRYNDSLHQNNEKQKDIHVLRTKFATQVRRQQTTNQQLLDKDKEITRLQTIITKGELKANIVMEQCEEIKVSSRYGNNQNETLVEITNVLKRKRVN